MARQLSSRGLTKEITFESAIAKLANTYHYHVCSRPTCRSCFYCTCGTPMVNPECKRCLHPQRDRPLWDQNRDRSSCCEDVKNLKQVTNSKVVMDYRLAGPGPWWQCQVCFRAHGMRKEQE